MSVKCLGSLILLTSLFVPHAAAAVTSLYVPENVGGSGLPITADPIGTDNSGHTTWLIGVGVPSGTFTATNAAPTSFSITMVEGPTDVHASAVINGTTAGEDCVIATATSSGGVPIASCVVQLMNQNGTLSLAGTETATPMPVQVADKKSGAGSLRMSLGGVALSALTIVGATGMTLVRAW